MRVVSSDRMGEITSSRSLVGFLQLSCLFLQCLFFSIEVVTLKHNLVKAVLELEILLSA